MVQLLIRQTLSTHRLTGVFTLKHESKIIRQCQDAKKIYLILFLIFKPVVEHCVGRWGDAHKWEGSEKSITGTRQWEGTGRAEGKSWGAGSDLSSLDGRPALSFTSSDLSSGGVARNLAEASATPLDIRRVVIFDTAQTDQRHEQVGG